MSNRIAAAAAAPAATIVVGIMASRVIGTAPRIAHASVAVIGLIVDVDAMIVVGVVGRTIVSAAAAPFGNRIIGAASAAYFGTGVVAAMAGGGRGGH